MDLTQLLKGKIVKVMTDAKVEVELEIKEVTKNNHSRDLEPATKENDWWPKSEDWSTISIIFTNGYRKTYKNLYEIQLVD